jgi:hypothetical protein
MPCGTPSSYRLAALLALAASVPNVTCQESTIEPDRCFILVASVTPAAPTLIPADSVQLTATYNAVAADCLPHVPAGSLVWRSADPQVATVDSTRGVVTARAVGNAQISAFVPGATRVLGFARVQVTP